MKWIIEYENDTGANDDSYSEWWTISDSTSQKSFTCYHKEDAEWLCDLLNKSDETPAGEQQPGEEKKICKVTGKECEYVCVMVECYLAGIESQPPAGEQDELWKEVGKRIMDGYDSMDKEQDVQEELKSKYLLIKK